MLEIVPGSEGDGGAEAEEEPGEPGYVSYVFALLFTVILVMRFVIKLICEQPKACSCARAPSLYSLVAA